MLSVGNIYQKFFFRWFCCFWVSLSASYYLVIYLNYQIHSLQELDLLSFIPKEFSSIEGCSAEFGKDNLLNWRQNEHQICHGFSSITCFHRETFVVN